MDKIEKLIARYGSCCAATARAGMSMKNLPKIEVDHNILRECEQREQAAAKELEAEVERLEEEVADLIKTTSAAQEIARREGKRFDEAKALARLARIKAAGLEEMVDAVRHILTWGHGAADDLRRDIEIEIGGKS